MCESQFSKIETNKHLLDVIEGGSLLNDMNANPTLYFSLIVKSLKSLP